MSGREGRLEACVAYIWLNSNMSKNMEGGREAWGREGKRPWLWAAWLSCLKGGSGGGRKEGRHGSVYM